MKKLALLILIATATSAFAQWNSAKVVSFDMKKSTVEGDSTFNANGNSGTLSTDKETHRNYVLTLDDGAFLYFAERTLESPLQRAPGITENGDVKFKLEKSKLTVIEENGREFKMNLVKKRKKA